MALTSEQRGRLLERIASILHEDVSTEGFAELLEAIDAREEDAVALFRGKRDWYLRSAARLLGGEASTQNGATPATSRRHGR